MDVSSDSKQLPLEHNIIFWWEVNCECLAEGNNCNTDASMAMPAVEVGRVKGIWALFGNEG